MLNFIFASIVSEKDVRFHRVGRCSTGSDRVVKPLGAENAGEKQGKSPTFLRFHIYWNAWSYLLKHWNDEATDRSVWHHCGIMLYVIMSEGFPGKQGCAEIRFRSPSVAF